MRTATSNTPGQPKPAPAAGAIDDLVFDFGLHRGEDTHFYLAKGFRVVSFEANPDLAAECRERFSAEMGSGRLTIIEGAIAPASAGDEVAFYVSSKSVWGTTDGSWVERNNKSIGATAREIRAPRVDVADIFSRFGVPHYMKIDIEGADKHVLDVLGMQPARPKFISIESEKADFDALLAEIETLRGLGYRHFKAVQQEYIPGTTRTIQRRNGESFPYTFPMDTSGPFGNEAAGEWLDHDGIVEAYRSIFRRYRLLGDGSPASHIPGKGRILWWIGRPTRTGLPGWYDTHASLE